MHINILEITLRNYLKTQPGSEWFSHLISQSSCNFFLPANYCFNKRLIASIFGNITVKFHPFYNPELVPDQFVVAQVELGA